MAKLIIYKVSDASRLNRLALPAFNNMTSLLEQGSIAFEKKIDSVYTEAEGCKITTDLALTAFQNNLLMLLGVDESWTPNIFYTMNSNAENITAGDSAHFPAVQFESNTQEELQRNDTITQDKQISSNSIGRHSINTIDSIPEMVTVEFISDLHVDGQDEKAFPIESNATKSRNVSTELNHNLQPQEASIDASGTAQLVQTDCTTQQHSDADEDHSTTFLAQHIENEINQEPVIVKMYNAENQSPNAIVKQNRPGDIILHKSVKKHASTEMKFRCFAVNWNKISDHLLIRLNALQDFKNINPGVFAPSELRFTKSEVSLLANAVVDQLRMIDTQIRAETMENVSRQILCKFSCLEFSDDDGFEAGQGIVELKYKMINRNNYLNRFKDTQIATKRSAMSLKKSRNARAGTIKEYWEKTSKECNKEILSIMKRDEPNMLTEEFLIHSQAYIRYRLDEKINVAKMITQLPVIRRRKILNFHFEKATGKDVRMFRKYFFSKRDKIIQYSLTCRSNMQLEKTSSDLDVLKFLCSLVGENIVDLVFQKEIGTRVDDITVDCSGPVLAAVDIGDNKRMYYVYADGTRLSEGTSDLVTAMEDLFSIHFVHNFMYSRRASKFLEFLQEYFLKIITLMGSKSTASRVGQRQRVVRKVITALSNFNDSNQT